ncbi:MAG: fatty acid desaturase [Planctomycetaceae bacterium]|jgi:fatty acid desaturase|nr:fatty acid desaturase [Planctomycetaceae bacterium]
MQSAATTLQRRQMFAEIKQLCEPDNYTNWFCILREYAIFGITVFGCLAAYQQITARGWSAWWAAPIYLLSAMVIGAWVQNRLSVLVHEASHYSLFKNRLVNDLAANFFLLFPVFGAITNYRIGHWGHHRHVNDPENDPDLQRLTRHQKREFPISRSRFLVDYVLRQLMIRKGISYLAGRALYVAIPMKSEPIQGHDMLGRPLLITLRVGYLVALCATLTLLDWWTYYALFWIVPLVTFYPAVLFLREIAHHGNYPDAGDFTNSRVYRANWLEREVFFPFGEHNHVLHHMFPTIPHHKMHMAHEVMMQYPPYRDQVVICNGFFFKADASSDDPTVLDILAAPADRYLRNQSADHSSDGDIRRSNQTQVGALVADVEQ